MKSVFWTLVRKDLYLLRGFSIATAVVGLGALALMGRGRVGFAVGGILFLTANVASGIFIAMYSFITERKDQSRLFALSLPISGKKYDLSKLVAALLSFGIPWLILTGAVVLSFLLPQQAEKGMLVYGLVIQGCIFALFCLFLALMFVIRSEHMAGLAIIVTNIVFSLFMVTVNQPDFVRPLREQTITWTPESLQLLSLQALIVVVSCALAFFSISRTRDHL